jgi:hypothetical protein
LGWDLKARIGEFELTIAAEHRRLRLSLVKYFGRTSPAIVLIAPVIYSLIIHLAFVYEGPGVGALEDRPKSGLLVARCC